jgi:hypothetical protein
MTPIVLEYCPVPWLRYSRKLTCSHPESWAELSPIQLIAAVRVMQETISDNELISVMLNIPVRLVKRFSLYQKFCIVDLMNFLQTHNPYYEFILPSIGQFHRPPARLKDETFGAFIFAETYFAKYVQSEDPLYRAKFIACFYRSGPFLEKDIAARALIIAKQPDANLEAIFVNYFLIREWFVEQYPAIFTPAEDQTKPEKSSWIDVYDAIVGDNLIQQDEYANLEISTVLRYLDKRIKANRTK